MTNVVKVNGESLRKMVKSATTVTVKSSPVSMCYSTLIKAENNRLTVCANNLVTAYKAVTDCTTSGDFEIVLDDDTIKKLLNVKGSDLTLEYTSGEKTVKVSDGRKNMMLVCTEPTENDFDYGSFTATFEYDWKTLFTIAGDELLNAVKTLGKFTAKDNLRPILCGYHIDNGDMVTIDGYRLGVKHLAMEKRTTDEWKFTADAQLENVKNIFEKSDNIHVSLDDSGKHSMYSTESGEISIQYAMRNIEGDFHNWRQSMPKQHTTEFTVTAGDVMEIAKEYKGYINAKNKAPFILGTYNGKLHGYIKTVDVSVSQEIPVDDLSGEIFAGYNIAYTLDIFSVFDKKEKVKCCNNGEVTPLLVSNGEYDCLLLPIRLVSYRYGQDEEAKKQLAEKRTEFEKTCA